MSSGSDSTESGTDDSDDEGPPECVKDCVGLAEWDSADVFAMCTLLREWNNSSCLGDCNATELDVIAEPMANCAPRTSPYRTLRTGTELHLPESSVSRSVSQCMSQRVSQWGRTRIEL